MPYKNINGQICGFVDILEKPKGGKFIRRFLVLNYASNTIDWYMDNPTNLSEEFQKPCDSIDINFITKVDIPLKPKYKSRFSFVINTPQRKYFLQAIDEIEQKSWVDYITNASKLKISDDEDQVEMYSSEERIPSIDSEIQRRSSLEDLIEGHSYQTAIVGGVVIKKVKEEKKSNVTDSSTSHKRQHSSSVLSKSESLNTVDTETIKSGWAVKQGHVRKNWKRRFFILESTGLSYYKYDSDPEPIHKIPIGSILDAKFDDGPMAQTRHNLFVVLTDDRKYFMQAESPEEMKSWVNSIRSVVTHASSKKRGSLTANKDTSYEAEKNNRKSSLQADYYKGHRKTNSMGTTSSRTTLTKSVIIKEESSNVTTVIVLPSSNQNFSGIQNEAKTKKTPSPKKEKSPTKKSPKKSSPKRSTSSIESTTHNIGLSPATPDVGSSPHSIDSSSKFAFFPSDKIPQIPELPSTSPAVDKSKKILRRTLSGSDAYPNDSPKKFGSDADVLPEIVDLALQRAPVSLPGSQVNLTEREEITGFVKPTSNIVPTKSFLFNNDPKVDSRGTVKPSVIKKRKNPGALFNLNNVLRKKIEKINKK